MTLRDDYSGAFDPDLTVADFSRRFLVRLGHEYQLIGHMLDRVGQPHPAVQVIARQVNPRASCRVARDRDGARFAWDVTIDPSAEPADEPMELQLARLSTGMRFRFEERRRPRGARS